MPASSPFLRLLLAIIAAFRWFAPASRRRDWQQQWQADIWHEWAWLRRRSAGIAGHATLARRTTGALHHAFWLRLHVRNLEMLTQDLRYGWRLMLRRPASTAAAVLTLGLGIGATTAAYGWLETTVFRPLPGVRDPGRVVILDGYTKTHNDIVVSYPEHQDYRAQRPDGIEDVIGYSMATMTLRDGDESIRAWAQMVTGNYFEMLGVGATLGRTIRPNDTATPTSPPVVVLSHRFWERHFRADPSVVGRTLIVNTHPMTVVGVADASFRGNEPSLAMDLWVPVTMPALSRPDSPRVFDRNFRWLQSMARLRPGATLEHAQAGLDLVGANLATAYPGLKDRSVRIFRTWEAPGRAGAMLLPGIAVLMGLALVVLLIACANVANLLLARGLERQRETAVRLALGARRWRLIRQLLTESGLLALAGGAVAIVVSYLAGLALNSLIPPLPVPIAVETSISAPTLGFALAISALTALAIGVIPAFQGASTSLLPSLKASTASISSGGSRARLRKALVVAQVAASVVLLVSASLFVRSLIHAQSVDPGFTTREGIMASLDLEEAGYDVPRGREYFRTLLARVRELPGVDAASIASRVPLVFWSQGEMQVEIDGYTPAANETLAIDTNRVGSDYFRTMGIRLVEGREFDDRDLAGARDVAIVNESFARRYFDGSTPMGRRIRIGPRAFEIVGMARDGKYTSVSELPRPYMYLPTDQWYRPATVLHVKTSGSPNAVVPALRAVVRELNPNVALYDVRTFEEHLRTATMLQEQVAGMLAAFGLIALLLSMVGLYAVIAMSVAHRTREIGMRMAFGAAPGRIITMFVRQGLAVTIPGLAIGVAAAAGVSQLFSVMLVGISATDWASFGGTTAALMLVGVAAAYLPARRAAAIDPMEAMRAE